VNTSLILLAIVWKNPVIDLNTLLNPSNILLFARSNSFSISYTSVSNDEVKLFKSYVTSLSNLFLKKKFLIEFPIFFKPVNDLFHNCSSFCPNIGNRSFSNC